MLPFQPRDIIHQLILVDGLTKRRSAPGITRDPALAHSRRCIRSAIHTLDKFGRRERQRLLLVDGLLERSLVEYCADGVIGEVGLENVYVIELVVNDWLG